MKPQPEFTPEELYALDEWTAKFVELQRVNWLVKGAEKWYPSSPDAPLWQMALIFEKANKGDLILAINKIVESKRHSASSLVDFCFQNPAFVLDAIRDVVTNCLPGVLYHQLKK